MLRLILTILFASAITVSQANSADSAPELAQINHIIVIYLENHSFDNLYGIFPGANGLAQAANAPPQTDRDGKPFTVLPPIKDARFPNDLPNRPFPIDQYVPAAEKIGDLVHRFYQNQAQINGGRNDHYATISDACLLYTSDAADE